MHPFRKLPASSVERDLYGENITPSVRPKAKKIPETRAKWFVRKAVPTSTANDFDAQKSHIWRKQTVLAYFMISSRGTIQDVITSAYFCHRQLRDFGVAGRVEFSMFSTG